MNEVLDFSTRVRVLPIVYGSGDFALQVRQRLLSQDYDCLAVALPPSLGPSVEEGVALLPQVSVVVQSETAVEESAMSYSYVPIDPCQGVIAAIREAVAADVDRAYVDLEVDVYEPQSGVFPDPYALKSVQLEKFLAAVLPVLPEPPWESQRQHRIRRMAHELHRLELDYEHIVFVCSVADWPWVRQAYGQRLPYVEHFAGPALPQVARPAEDSLFFVLGELPFITHLYEHRRAELAAQGEQSMALDGVKALLLEARDVWASQVEVEDEGREQWLSPHVIGALLTYVRNLSLFDRRLTPDLYNLALAAKQVGGDDFALAVIETSRRYPPQRLPSAISEEIDVGLGRMVDADGEVRTGKDRLQGARRVWRSLPLKPSPPPIERRQWGTRWDPFGQCSHPPEDRRIESFQKRVKDQAMSLAGEDPRIEKFTASLKDGLDLRESLRNWHSGELYVRELPATMKGSVEIVVFLFEQDGGEGQEARFSWRSTWYAEHEEESTLCFFATPFADNMVGPGIGQAVYGGCLFIFPPRPIPDVWTDRRFEKATSSRERLFIAALAHSREKRVVLVAPRGPSAKWRRLARLYRKQLIFIPLRRFPPRTIDRLRRFHVLNGKHVRSYASRFIRDMR